jgi:cytochrome c peroxidase
MILLALACSQEPYSWDLPAHIPPPSVPEDSPMSPERVELGRRLFYDTRLSIDGDMSCASCHQQALAFSDGRARGVGTTGEVHPRGAMSLTNVAYAPRLAWANPLVGSLEVQAMLPLFGEEPIELGMSDVLVLTRLSASADYARWFLAAWPEETAPITMANVVAAIASFERTLLSFSSPYDAYVAGDEDALSPQEKRGMELFFSERLECFHCHGGFNFTDTMDHSGMAIPEVAFHNTALYDLDGAGSYPADNTGLAEITGKPSDMGRFRAPTLRNIAVTAPYMHDGSIGSLSEVLDHYALGGRAASSPLKSEFVAGFLITDDEKADVIAFLEALTDRDFLTDPSLSDPWR